ncbi:MAG: transposase [Gemmataceae bacterium]
MKAQRRTFTPEQKVAFLRLHLLENKPVSDNCEENGIAVNLFYKWQKEFFENGASGITGSSTTARPTNTTSRFPSLEFPDAR